MKDTNKSGQKKRVAIVVALSKRAYLTPDEEISLRHLRHYLGNYDKYLVMPESLDFGLDDFNSARFADSYFGSVEAHKRLLFSAGYYQAFSDYEFMLTYHLDALVFSDQLEYWCGKNYDFIGAPWGKHKDAPYYGRKHFENKVGNGGFCLKKVSSFLEVFNSKKGAIDPDEYWEKYHSHRGMFERIWHYPKKLLMGSRRFNNLRWEMERWGLSEELFIADRASYYYPEFTIAPLDEALQFGFECVPRYCYELNGNRLPFGCHAWERYDREFWEQFLLQP
ncbi:MAG: DUF5672 family protein [Gammaproteobacteria bacterium]